VGKNVLNLSGIDSFNDGTSGQNSNDMLSARFLLIMFKTVHPSLIEIAIPGNSSKYKRNNKKMI
jgi:hypothetical protein